MNNEYTYPLTVHTGVFVGTKPVAVLFGGERLDVKTWRQVVGVILGKCNLEQHERLMSLRDKVGGRVRTIFASSDLTMRRPLKITDDCFIETHYGSQTMMYILRDLILAYTGFDTSNVSIIIRR